MSSASRCAPLACVACVFSSVVTAEPTAAAAIANAGPSPEVVVTAVPLKGAGAAVARPARVLHGPALSRQSVRNVGEMLSDQPGVTAGDFGPNVGRPIIRGLGGARVRVMDDGIGAMDVSTVSPDHALAIDPVFASRVEIFRGPATLLYGNGGSGGMVNVIDERVPEYVPERPGGELYAHYDSAADGRLGAARLEAGIGQYLATRLSFAASDSGDYEIPGFASRSPAASARPGRLANSDGEHDDVTAGASLVAERGFIGLAIESLDRNYGVPGGHVHGPAAEAEADGAGVRIDQAQTRYDLKAALEAPLPWLDVVRTRWGFNDHRHAELEASGAVGTELFNDEWEGRIEADHVPVGRLSGTVGIQLQHRDFEARGEEAFVPPSAQRAIAAFGVEKIDLGATYVEIGARYEHTSARERNSGREVDRGAYAISVDVGWQVRPDQEIGLAVTHAQRAPAIEELFANGPHLATNTFEIGSTDLALETSTNVDFRWRRRGERWRMEASVYYNDIADFVFAVEQDTNADGIADRVEPDFAATGAIVAEPDALLFVRQAQADARLAGVEIEGAVRVFGDGRDGLEWRVFSDYVDGELRGGGGDLPRMPPLRVGTGLDWTRGRWAAGLAVTRTAAQNEIARLETPTGGHTLLDAYAEYVVDLPADAELTLFARGSNLLNETIRRHVSFLKDVAPLPGAAALVGMRMRF